MEKFFYRSLKPNIFKWFVYYYEIINAMTTTFSSKNLISFFTVTCNKLAMKPSCPKNKDNNLYY